MAGTRTTRISHHRRVRRHHPVLVGQGGEGPAAEVRGGHESAIWSPRARGAHHAAGRRQHVQVLVSQQTREVPRDTTQRSGPAAMAEQEQRRP